MPTGIYDHSSRKIHGLTNTSIYRVWKNMKNRCNNSNCDMYYRYGGRGITYYKRWEIFQEFYKDMGESYQRGLTLERINVNKDYSPKNCRWATIKEQANNKSNNHYINYKNTNKTLTEWAEYTGLKASTIRMRLSKYNWSIEEALTKGVTNVSCP